MNEVAIGRAISERRKALNLNQSALAELAQVSRTTLSALETGAGNRGATISTLIAVLTVLGLSIALIEAKRA